MRYVVRSVDGGEYGPFTSDDLRQLVREQRLGPGDFVRREEGRTWSPFEKIAGLAELVGGDDEPGERDDADPTVSGPTPSTRPVAPTESRRPRLDPSPEHLSPTDTERPPGTGFQIGIDLDSILPDPTPPPSDPPPVEQAPPPRTGSTVPVDPARSTNPFVAAGLPVALLPDEEIGFVLVQSFADAARASLIGAVLGHRGRLVCTNRRAVTIVPGFGRSSMTIVWLDRITAAGVRSRTSLGRMILGVLCLLYAAYALVGSLAVGAAMSAIGGGLNGASGIATALGTGLAAFAGLLGVAVVLTARARTVMIGDTGDGIVFPCAAASPWHLARIDDGRMQSVGLPTPSTPTS